MPRFDWIKVNTLLLLFFLMASFIYGDSEISMKLISPWLSLQGKLYTIIIALTTVDDERESRVGCAQEGKQTKHY